MSEALRLARLGEGLTRPNPPVGAVIVRNGRVVGRGFHRVAGGPHAEVAAFRQAGEAARGATLYVTLEPCCTWGRTPPCTEAILAAGIRRVVIATSDPNPRHAGRGLRILRRAGVQVKRGVLEAEAKRVLAPFASTMTRGRPFVSLKLAVSLDGKVADSGGRSKWISGPAARGMVQELRRRCDAVIVGATTAERDNPSLLPRPARGREPYRVIVDSAGRLPLSAKVLTDESRERTILATTARCPEARRSRYEAAGARVWCLPASNGRVSIKALMRKLQSLGLLHLLLEGGGELAEAWLRAGYVDELVWFVAPLVIGGKGVPGVGGKGWPLAGAPQFTIVETRRVGPDVMIRAVGRIAKERRTTRPSLAKASEDKPSSLPKKTPRRNRQS
jgi:diaminohydroxyphosphoribosylaminopyrimidine deaminase/5-amino-6-(5-phosphoribosylamino)uracil reductase